MEKEEQKISGFVVLSSTRYGLVSIRFLRASSITYIKKTSIPVVVTPRLFASRVLYSPSPRCRVCVCVCPPITICHLSKRRRQTPRSEAESAPHRFSTCFSPAGRKRVTRRRLNLKRTTTRRSVPCARTWSKIQPCLSRPGRVCVCVCFFSFRSSALSEDKRGREEERGARERFEDFRSE